MAWRGVNSETFPPGISNEINHLYQPASQSIFIIFVADMPRWIFVDRQRTCFETPPFEISAERRMVAFIIDQRPGIYTFRLGGYVRNKDNSEW